MAVAAKQNNSDSFEQKLWKTADEVEDTVSFEERMQELTITLGEQMREAQRLDDEIKTQLLKVGFKIGDI
jgi:hypothetical protein